MMALDLLRMAWALLVIAVVMMIGVDSAPTSACHSCSSEQGPPTESLLIGGFTNYKYYTLGTAIAAVNGSLYTHLVYRSALNPTGARCAPTQAWLDTQERFGANALGDDSADPERGAFNQLRRLKLRYPHLKVLASVADYDHSGDLSQSAANATLRAALVASCVDMAERYGFDGLNLDWRKCARAAVAAAGEAAQPDRH